MKWRIVLADKAKIVGLLSARPGKAVALKELLLGMVTPSRAEPGNLKWDIWQEQSNPDRYVLDELYIDNDALAAHRDTPHFKNYAAKVGELAERTPLVLSPVEVAG